MLHNSQGLIAATICMTLVVLFLHLRVRELTEFTGSGRNPLDLILPIVIVWLTLFIGWNFHNRMINARNQTSWNITAELILNASLATLMIGGIWIFHLLRGRSGLSTFWIQSGILFVGAVIISSLSSEWYRFRKHNKSATAIRLRFNRRQRLDVTPEGTVTFPLYKNGATAFRPEDILGIEQNEEGIRIHLQQQGVVVHEALACDMKTVRDILRKHTAFYRCSRSWMVNMDRVTGIDADAAGFRLSLADNALEIGVSSQLNEELGVRLSK
jgi:hypothetical protein